MSQQVYSVASLVHYIKETLDHDFNLQSFLIKGEISNFTNHRSGHWYFTLKDTKSKISCVMFASYASRSKFLLKEGMKVILTASVSMYEAGGSLQLYVTKVQNDGLGDLFLQLEEVKQKLSKEGLFDPSHKKELPSYPMRIGIISAKTGAAIQDILATIARRWPVADVSVYPSLVQGVQASQNMIEQLSKADQDGHDVILLARGGGAIEDLWCFNDEALARCIYDMKTVIVTGVGHETDTTLVDYVSDLRALTPTDGAQKITPDRNDVRQHLTSCKAYFASTLNNMLQQERLHIQRIKRNRYIQDPSTFIAQEQLKLAMRVKELSIVERHAQKMSQQLQTRLHQMALQAKRLGHEQTLLVNTKETRLHTQLYEFFTLRKQQLQGKIQLLDAFSPLKILARGYHITYQNEHIIKSIHDVNMKDELQLQMQDGIVHASIVKKEEV